MNEASFQLDLGNKFIFKFFKLFLVVEGYNKECDFLKNLKNPSIYDAFKRDYVNIVHFNLTSRSVVWAMRLCLSFT